MKNVMMYLNNNWFSIQLPADAVVSSADLVIEIPEADNMPLEKIVAYMVQGFNKSFWLDAELRKDAANKLADLLYSELPLATIIRLMIPHWDHAKTKVSPQRFLEMDEIQILANQILYLIEKCLLEMEGPSEFLITTSVTLEVQFKMIIEVVEYPNRDELIEEYVSNVLANASNWEDFSCEVSADRITLLL